jgi:hypothetical protein
MEWLFLFGMIFGAMIASFCWWITYSDRIGTYRTGGTSDAQSGWEHDGTLYTAE